MLKFKLTLCAAGLGMLSSVTAAAGITGYAVDGSGAPVRTGSGECVRTGTWSMQTPAARCDAMPDRIILLPGPDGKTGALVVRSAKGEKLLNTAYAAAQATNAGIVEGHEDAASVQQRFGAVLNAQSPRPVAFMVHFLTGSASELTPESQPVIAEMKATLTARPAPEVTVIGHTDRVGNALANDALSLKRAETVRNMLAEAGIVVSSLDAAGRGEREPLVATPDEVAEPQNRRVEISVR